MIFKIGYYMKNTILCLVVMENRQDFKGTNIGEAIQVKHADYQMRANYAF